MFTNRKPPTPLTSSCCQVTILKSGEVFSSDVYIYFSSKKNIFLIEGSEKRKGREEEAELIALKFNKEKEQK